MDVPIYVNGRAAGRLAIRQEGLYTVFTASLPPMEGLTRLWVFGGGQSGCLGLMAPGPEGLRLIRRLTKLERRRLPAVIDCAAAMPPSGDGWTERVDGSLVDPVRRLIALPARLRRETPGLRLLGRNGRMYLVFHY